MYNENNISKSSYEDRVNWLNNNINKILDMNPEFICRK